MHIHAVALPERHRLLREIEGADHFGRCQQSKRAIVVGAHGKDVGLLFETALLLLKAGKQPLPTAGAQRRQVGVQGQLGNPVIRQRAVGIDPHRVEDRTEPARSLAVTLLDEPRRPVGHYRHHRHVGRQHPVAATQHRDDRAVVGPIVRKL